MIANHWIENSRKAYAALLNLYPKEHRGDYGVSMRQVFTDQCRSAYQQKGAPGVILLWLRTLPDLGRTALLEHVTSPRAAWGLMEPVPNAPLPWKGIFLILLPGLVYLVSQIAQLTGQPWYLTVYYRAAFFLIIPVLLVWAVTRRFPIWGLIPLGLLYRLVQEIGYQLIVLHPGVFSSNPLLDAVLTAARTVQNELLIPVAVFSVAIALLAWRYVREQNPSRAFWVWIGIYLAMIVAQMASKIGWVMWYAQENASTLSPDSARELLNNTIRSNLYDITALLLLIFIGTLFTRRHGFFAILIPVGYLLPAIILGVGMVENAADPTNIALIAGAAILAYRLLLSLVAPVWMSRTRSQAGKKRVALVSIAIALGIHFAMQFFPYLFVYTDLSYLIPQIIQDVLLTEAMLISAVMLGATMYQNSRPMDAAPIQPVGEVRQAATE